LTQNKKNLGFRYIYSGDHQDMKKAMQRMTKAVYDNIIRRERNEAYLFFVQDTVPFHCSEGELKEPICQRLIGYAILRRQLYPPKVAVNTAISASDNKYTFVAYLKDNKGEVSMVKLPKNQNQALTTFN
jgi:hypothetical protein